MSTGQKTETECWARRRATRMRLSRSRPKSSRLVPLISVGWMRLLRRGMVYLRESDLCLSAAQLLSVRGVRRYEDPRHQARSADDVFDPTGPGQDQGRGTREGVIGN